MALLILKVVGPDAAPKVIYRDFEHLNSNPALLLQDVRQAAREMAPGVARIKVTYTDDEGDICTLTEQTAMDAVTFATLQQDGHRCLSVSVSPAIGSQGIEVTSIDEANAHDSFESVNGLSSQDVLSSQPSVEASMLGNGLSSEPVSEQPSVPVRVFRRAKHEVQGDVKGDAGSLYGFFAGMRAEKPGMEQVVRVFRRDSATPFQSLKQRLSREELGNLCDGEGGTSPNEGSKEDPDTSPDVAPADTGAVCTDSQVEEKRREVVGMEVDTVATCSEKSVKDRTKEDLAWYVEELQKCKQEAQEQFEAAEEAKKLVHDILSEQRGQTAQKLEEDEAGKAKMAQELEEARLEIDKWAKRADQVTQDLETYKEQVQKELTRYADDVKTYQQEVHNQQQAAEEAKQLVNEILAAQNKVPPADFETMKQDLELCKQELSKAHKDVQEALRQVHDAEQEASNAWKETKEALHQAQVAEEELLAARNETEEAMQRTFAAEARASSAMNDVATATHQAHAAEEMASRTMLDLEQAMLQVQAAAEERSNAKNEIEHAMLQAREAKEDADSAKKEYEEAIRRAEAAMEEANNARMETEEATRLIHGARADASKALEDTEEAVRMAQAAKEEASSMRTKLEEAASQAYAASEEANAAKKENEEILRAASRQSTHNEEMQTRFQAALLETEAQAKAAAKEAHEMRSSLTCAEHQVEALSVQLEVAIARGEAAEKAVAAQQAQKVKDASPLTQASAIVQNCRPLTLAIEAQEDDAARGDFTSKFLDLVAKFKAQQAVRIGRVFVSGLTSPAPVCSYVVVKNNGLVKWPETTVMVSVEGDNMGFPMMPLSSLDPGQTVEIEMDLMLPPKSDGPAETRSVWALTDAATGARLGPVFVLEAVWKTE
jgi:hypothetical protein